MRKYKKNTVLEVVWEDIVEDAGWLKEEQAIKAEPSTMLSLGYYLNHDTKCLRISCSLSDSMDRNVTVIPLSNVVKVYELKRK